jgi:hypothetical protein
MNKLIAVLYILYFISYMMGCALGGDVYINSPQGEGISVDKTISTNAEVPLRP